MVKRVSLNFFGGNNRDDLSDKDIMTINMDKVMETERLYRKNAYLTSMEAKIVVAECNRILLDKTVFYPQGGGQPGDSGRLILKDGTRLNVTGTYSDHGNYGLIWHEITRGETEKMDGLPVTGFLDWDRRYKLMKMHSCLHVLSAIVAAPITGCSIGEDKGRLDFNLPDPILTRESITNGLNDILIQNKSVESFDVNEHGMGKYNGNKFRNEISDNKKILRMVKIDGLDIQPCAGTHVKNTMEIPRIKCVKIEKKSKTNRRVVIAWD